MAEAQAIPAEVRAQAGKGVARAARRMGRVPAVIYGDKMDPVMISVDGKEITRHIADPRFFTTVVEVEVGGDKHQVLARDVQFDPVTDRPLHIDFLRFNENTKINVEVPVNFINDELSPGLKRGGVLNIVRREIELLCAPLHIPQELTFDLDGLEIGDSIHISAIELPDGVTPTVSDRDFTVATVAAPTILTVEEESEGEEGEEGEEGVEGAEGAEGTEAAGGDASAEGDKEESSE